MVILWFYVDDFTGSTTGKGWTVGTLHGALTCPVVAGTVYIVGGLDDMGALAHPVEIIGCAAVARGLIATLTITAQLDDGFQTRSALVGDFDKVVVAVGANERIKNKARDLKDMVEKDVERLSKVKH